MSNVSRPPHASAAACLNASASAIGRVGICCSCQGLAMLLTGHLAFMVISDAMIVVISVSGEDMSCPFPCLSMAGDAACMRVHPQCGPGGPAAHDALTCRGHHNKTNAGLRTKEISPTAAASAPFRAVNISVLHSGPVTCQPILTLERPRASSR
jgi:hypothetical protein